MYGHVQLYLYSNRYLCIVLNKNTQFYIVIIFSNIGRTGALSDIDWRRQLLKSWLRYAADDDDDDDDDIHDDRDDDDDEERMITY